MKKLPICTSLPEERWSFFLKGFGDRIAPILEKPVRDTTQLIVYHVPRRQVASPHAPEDGSEMGE